MVQLGPVRDLQKSLEAEQKKLQEEQRRVAELEAKGKDEDKGDPVEAPWHCGGGMWWLFVAARLNLLMDLAHRFSVRQVSVKWLEAQWVSIQKRSVFQYFLDDTAVAINTGWVGPIRSSSLGWMQTNTINWLHDWIQQHGITISIPSV